MSAKTPRRNFRLLAWLEVLAVIAWGSLLLKYWLTGALNVLIHPNYFGLVAGTGAALLLMGIIKGYQLYRDPGSAAPATGHISLLPSGWTTALLLVTAGLGLMTTPRVFASTTAIQRGVTEAVTATRAQPQSFRSQSKPENRSLVDWIRTLNTYPEPDTYSGQKVNINGFVVAAPQLGNNYFLLTRFILTCCAADAYPIALPVQLTSDSSSAYKPDSWLQVQGKMATVTLEGKRQLVVVATDVQSISPPQNPYDY
jgi:uncharacterized repeat protein (TIGR03943 family)